jgi:hypothetical protein
MKRPLEPYDRPYDAVSARLGPQRIWFLAVKAEIASRSPDRQTAEGNKPDEPKPDKDVVSVHARVLPGEVVTESYVARSSFRLENTPVAEP